jgi:Fe-S-cluster-containing dehydrogenase component
MSCPREALSIREEDGTILVDHVKCNSCGLCIAACEFGAMSLHPEKNIANVCDLCKGEPKCVEACPKGALYFDTIDEVVRKSEVDVVKPLLLEFEDSRTHSKPFYKREGFLDIPSQESSKD